MLRLFRSSFWSSNLLNTSYPRLLVMSKCTVSPPFRTESSSLVIYPCRLWEPFVTSELWYLWLSGSGSWLWTLFHGPYLVLQLIRCDVFGRFISLFAIGAIVACMNVACVFLLYNNDAYVGVCTSNVWIVLFYWNIALSFFSVSFDELINSSGNSSHFASNASCRVLVSSRSTLILASCKMIPFLLSSESMV